MLPKALAKASRFAICSPAARPPAMACHRVDYSNLRFAAPPALGGALGGIPLLGYQVLCQASWPSATTLKPPNCGIPVDDPVGVKSRFARFTVAKPGFEQVRREFDPTEADPISHSSSPAPVIYPGPHFLLRARAWVRGLRNLRPRNYRALRRGKR